MDPPPLGVWGAIKLRSEGSIALYAVFASS
jgi:hypothetical protein